MILKSIFTKLSTSRSCISVEIKMSPDTIIVKIVFLYACQKTHLESQMFDKRQKKCTSKNDSTDASRGSPSASFFQLIQ